MRTSYRRAFARYLGEGGGPNVLMSMSRVRQAKPQLGEYDSQILCASCDGKLGVFDGYAVEVFRSFQSEHRVVAAGTEYEFAPFDGDKFAKALLAILWRGSITKSESFRLIDLGAL